jgi:hypothetical protein
VEPKSLAVIDLLCEECIGSFIHPLYSKEKQRNRKRIWASLKGTFDKFTKKICKCCRKPKYDMNCVYRYLRPLKPALENDENYSKQQKLRDLFLWSVFMGYDELAKILLVHLKPRVCASLIASKIFTVYSQNTNILQFKEKMKNIADEFELYAVKCLDLCYEYNEAKACELILRQIPLFGNITCAQVCEIRNISLAISCSSILLGCSVS